MTSKIRPIRVEGNIAYVPLSRGYEAEIDAADILLVAGFNWHAMVCSHGVYAKRNDLCGRKYRTVLMHRAIMGTQDGLEVDHVDGNGLNNCRSNLREVTRSQNMMNQRISKRNKSGSKGVSWDRAKGKWRAQIMVNKKMVCIGRFDDIESASAAYRDASARLHGEFGREE